MPFHSGWEAIANIMLGAGNTNAVFFYSLFSFLKNPMLHFFGVLRAKLKGRSQAQASAVAVAGKHALVVFLGDEKLKRWD